MKHNNKLEVRRTNPGDIFCLEFTQPGTGRKIFADVFGGLLFANGRPASDDNHVLNDLPLFQKMIGKAEGKDLGVLLSGDLGQPPSNTAPRHVPVDRRRRW